MEHKSKCCNAPIEFEGGEEYEKYGVGTCNAKCTECGEYCDIIEERDRYKRLEGKSGICSRCGEIEYLKEGLCKTCTNLPPEEKPTRKIYILKNGYTFQDVGEGSTARLYKGDWENLANMDYCIIHDEDIFKEFLKSADLIERIEE